MINGNKIYTIDADDTGKCYDLRNTAEYDTPLKIKDISSDLYFTNYTKFVYGLTVDYDESQPIPITEENIDNWQKFSVTDGILQDINGFFLFSKKLISKFGIGFILSSWLHKDEDGKIVVKFNPKYLRPWFNNSVPETDIIDDEIYSCTEEMKFLFPDLYQKDISLVPNENFFKQNIWYNYSNCLYGNTFEDFGISYSIWNRVLLSRRYPGTPFLKIKDLIPPTQEGELPQYNGIETFYLSDISSEIDKTIIYPVDLTYMGAHRYFFALCKLQDFENTLATLTIPEYYNGFVRWDNRTNTPGLSYLYYYTGVSNPPPMEYDLTKDDTTYTDCDTFFLATDSNEVTPLTKLAKYKIFSSLEADIEPISNISGLNKYTYKTFKKSSSQKSVYVPIVYEIGTDKTVEEILNEKLEENKTLFKTPSEYYSSLQLDSETANIENPLDNYDRNWFWLDTIKNWCLYMEENSILYLYCWNGINGWDSIQDIILNKTALNLFTLAERYLYSPYFFEEGVCTPPDRFGLYSPVRYPNNAVAQIFYTNLILSRDTVAKTYNNKFQNLHDTKLYLNGERNDIAKNGMGIRSGLSKTYAGNVIVVDGYRKAIFAVPTEYCPTIFKLANGNLSISYRYYVNGNGYAVTTETNPFHIISAEEANIRCKTIFGDGNDKTITKDWKRYFSTDNVEEQATRLKYNTEETIYGVPNLTLNVGDSTINTIKLKTTRPNPTTQNKDLTDFIERWNR